MLTQSELLDHTEALIKAVLNRLTIRLGQKIASSAEEIANIAENVPTHFRKEWDEFKEEVIEEYEKVQAKDKNMDSENEADKTNILIPTI